MYIGIMYVCLMCLTFYHICNNHSPLLYFTAKYTLRCICIDVVLTWVSMKHCDYSQWCDSHCINKALQWSTRVCKWNTHLCNNESLQSTLSMCINEAFNTHMYQWSTHLCNDNAFQSTLLHVYIDEAFQLSTDVYQQSTEEAL